MNLKKIITAGSVLTLQYTLVFAELEPFEGKNDKYGYKNEIDKVVIPAQYDKAYDFSKNGLAEVELNFKYGFINKKGKVVIPIKYDEAWDFDEKGLALVSLKGKWGHINMKDEMVKTEEAIKPKKVATTLVDSVQNITLKVESAKEVIKQDILKEDNSRENVKLVKQEIKALKAMENTHTILKEIYIQSGVFGNQANIIKAESAIFKNGLQYKSIKIEKFTKVMIGPFNSLKDAKVSLSMIKARVNKDAFIVKL